MNGIARITWTTHPLVVTLGSMVRSAKAAAASALGMALLASPCYAHANRSAGADDAAIRPFRVNVPQATLDDLRKRLLATRWIYWENRGRELINATAQRTDEISIPVAITVFANEVLRAQESWARRAFRNLVYFNEVDRGGHYAAWEEPEIFAAELRAAFRSLH
jgi:pimeloyl-ACP methyl ester carboxylesterase